MADSSRPSTTEVAAAVARVTFLEIVRDKVLYNAFVLAILLLAAAMLAARLAVIAQDRLVLDFGLAGVSISCALIGVLTGAGMVGREYDRRTILVALSRPVSTLQFLTGKFLGLAAVLALNWLILSLALGVILALASIDAVWPIFTGALAWGLLLALLQSLLLAALALFFSSFSTTSLAVVFTIGCILIGNNLSQLRALAAKEESPVGAFLMSAAATVLPDLERFTLGTKVTYGLAVSWKFGLAALLYTVTLSAACVLLASLLVRRREA